MAELIVACPGCGKKFRIQEEAKPGEFKCTSCGGSVPYGNIPRARPAQAVPAGRQKGPARAVPAGRGAPPRGAAGRAPRGRGAPQRGGPARGRRGGRSAGDDDYGPPLKDNTALYVVLAIVGVLVVGGGVAAIALSGGGDDLPQVPPVAQNPNAGTSAPLRATPAEPDPGEPLVSSGGDTIADAPVRTPPSGSGNAPESVRPDPADSSRLTGGRSGEGIPAGASLFGQNRGSLKMLSNTDYDRVVAELPPIEGTSDALQKEIDEGCATLVDFHAGGAATRASRRLVEIGKPAVPRILSSFRKVGTLSDMEAVANCRMVEETLRGIVGNPLKMTPISPMAGLDVKAIKRTIASWYIWWYTDGHKLDSYSTGGGEGEDGEEE